MVEKTIVISGRDYYFQDEFGNKEQAYEHGRRWKETRKAKYFVLEVKRGVLIKEQAWILYLSKKLRII